MSVGTKERVMTIPEVYAEHEAFWAATAEGKYLLKKCDDCQQVHYYPRTFCPHCHSENVDWIEASGKGNIHTYSVMRHGTPYAIAFVELEEGPIVMTNIVDCDLDTIHIDQAVTIVFKQSGNGDEEAPYVPCFTPVTEGGETT